MNYLRLIKNGQRKRYHLFPSFALSLVLSVSFFGVTSAGAKNKAILVGIDNYPAPVPRLRGAKNDVTLVKSFLIEKLDFDPVDIVVLLDEEATSGNITKAIKDHFLNKATTTKDDAVFFYFAGHGTGVKDYDGDEADGLDETLLTYDFDPLDQTTWFTDDLLYNLFRYVPTQKVITIFDCCHSGTGNRGGAEEPAGGPSYRARYSDSGWYTFDMESTNPAFARSLSMVSAKPDYHVFFAACQDEEKAWEGNYDGKVHGLFTSALVREFGNKSLSSLEGVTAMVKSEIVNYSSNKPGLKRQTPAFSLSYDASLLSLREYLSSKPGPPDSVVTSQNSEAEGVPRLTPPTLDDVVPGYRPRGDIGVELTVRNAKTGTIANEFSVGDLIEIELLSDSNGFAEIYYYGVDNTVYRIFPNGEHSDNAIRAAEKVVIPGEDMKFLLRMALPEDFEPEVANEVLVAIVSTEPFSEEKSEETKERLFQIVDARELNPAADRLIEVVRTGSPRFGEAIKIYRIRK